MNKPLVSVIIQSYNSRRYIEKCLDSLLVQDYPRLEILLIINGSQDGSGELIRSKYGSNKKIRILEPGENLFFSRGNNLGIVETSGEYILSLNQDTVMEQSYVKLLIEEMEKDPNLGSSTGKLLHYQFDIDSKTKLIDSTGLEIFKTRRVIDRGQWEIDQGQYDSEIEIFGASGAAAMFRRSALEDIKLPKKDGSFEYNDESFVAYKEDVDLAWRLQLAGYKCRYVPAAKIYHGRSIGRSWPTQFIRFILNRRRQPRFIRQLSFRNHYLMMIKNEVLSIFWRHFVYILSREILLLLYTIIFEPFQIKAFHMFFRELSDARRKRKIIMSKMKVKAEELRAIFH